MNHKALGVTPKEMQIEVENSGHKKWGVHPCAGTNTQESCNSNFYFMISDEVPVLILLVQVFNSMFEIVTQTIGSERHCPD